MEEVFRAIEDKIRETGYDGLIDGETFYDEICDEIEGLREMHFGMSEEHT